MTENQRLSDEEAAALEAARGEDAERQPAQLEVHPADRVGWTWLLGPGTGPAEP